MDQHPQELIDRFRHVIRRKHYSPRTEESCRNWIKRFIHLHGQRHPRRSRVPARGLTYYGAEIRQHRL